MVVRILMVLMLIVLGAGFIFFMANVLWLGTKEFFKIYGPKQNRPNENKSAEKQLLNESKE